MFARQTEEKERPKGTETVQSKTETAVVFVEQVTTQGQRQKLRVRQKADLPHSLAVFVVVFVIVIGWLVLVVAAVLVQVPRQSALVLATV